MLKPNPRQGWADSGAEQRAQSDLCVHGGAETFP